MNEKNEMIVKLNFFKDSNTKVHIETKADKFYNGFIVEFENENVIVFNDRVLGLIHVFVFDIKLLEEFR